MRELPVNATAVCADGDAGWITDVVVDPKRRAVTHVVVRENQTGAREFLVPLDQVADSSRKRVTLRCARADLTRYPEYTTTKYVPASSPEAQPVVAEWEMQAWNYYHAYEPIYTPVVDPDTPVPVDEHHIPYGEIAFERGAQIESSDDALVGTVAAFLVDPDSGAIHHVVVTIDTGGSPREVILPVTAVAGSGMGTLRLRLSQAQLDQLPAVPPGGEYSSAVHLVSIIFDQPQKADDALVLVQRTWPKLDAAVVRKNPDGSVSSMETHDMSTRRGAVAGAVIGGVLSVIAGPVGIVAASTIGGAAGAAVGHADRGVPNGYIRDLGRALDSGSSALITLVPEKAEPALLEAVADLHGEVLQLELTDEMLARLTTPPQ